MRRVSGIRVGTPDKPPLKPVHGFDLEALTREWEARGVPYLEFLRRDALSLGLYILPAGGDDKQQPHTEDEVYVVLAGRAVLDVSGQAVPVRAGSVVFVAQGAPHRFRDIEEDLATLVVFAPAEGAGGRES